MNPPNPRYDVIIAGARCAGAATAMLLARRGLDVLVVDPTPPHRDTLSTHALMRAGVLQLHRWGLLDAVRAAGTPAITTTTFDYGDDPIAIPIEPRDGVDALFAPRRTVLDPILVASAMDAGATVKHGCSLVDLERDASGRVRGAWIAGACAAADPVARTIAGALVTRVEADLVIGADGIRSRVARIVGAPVEHRGRYRTASIYGYWPGLARDRFDWRFRPGVSIGVIPTNDELACVFASVTGAGFAEARSEGLEALHFDAVRSIDPDLAVALQRRHHPGVKLRAFAGEPGFLRRSHGPGWALVGDAGYFRDPLTAHGITDAFRDAELLATAVLAGREGAYPDYQAERDSVALDFMRLTDRIASLDWSLDEVKELHLELSRAMNAGLDRVRRMAPAAPPRQPGAPAARGSRAVAQLGASASGAAAC